MIFVEIVVAVWCEIFVEIVMTLVAVVVVSLVTCCDKCSVCIESDDPSLV